MKAMVLDTSDESEESLLAAAQECPTQAIYLARHGKVCTLIGAFATTRGSKSVQHRRIIKRGPVVFATREDGSMDPSSASSQGLFLADTRYLSIFQIRIDDEPPILLGSSEEILFQASFLHTNAALPDVAARGLGVLQRNLIDQEAVKVEVTLANWALRPVEVELSFEMDSDFLTPLRHEESNGSNAAKPSRSGRLPIASNWNTWDSTMSLASPEYPPHRRWRSTRRSERTFP
jgi:hypothetical protein